VDVEVLNEKAVSESPQQRKFKAEVKCPICKASLAMLEDATIEESVKLFKKHLPSHTLPEIYDFTIKNGSQVFPSIIWEPSPEEKPVK
jgi:hypothetical protein